MSCISTACQGISKSVFRISWPNAVRSFSACSNITLPGACQNNMTAQYRTSIVSPTFLVPPSLLVVPAAGMKQMGKLRKRCRHCFFIMIDERLHIWCDVHPRHKQMQMIPKPRTLLKLTHATQGKIRPW